MNANLNSPICFHCMASLPTPDAPCPHCGSKNSEVENLPNQLPCGTVLDGKYLIGRVLGQGGFGITYIGLDLNLDLRVAIKEYFPSGLILRDSTSGTTVQPISAHQFDIYERSKLQFINEARVLAQFSDEPGIVSVREFFDENNTSYFAMEYVDGKTLKEIQKERNVLSIDEVLRMLHPVMSALTKAHEANLLHRDISPDNIILRDNGMAVLIDFGAARTMSARKTHSLSVIVKPGYAAPEQYLSRGDQGPWTDVYSLCATIYKLTTGKTPPPSLDIQSGTAILKLPSVLGATMSKKQEYAVMRGLSSDRKDRQPTILELQRELSGKRIFTRKRIKTAFICLSAFITILILFYFRDWFASLFDVEPSNDVSSVVNIGVDDRTESAISLSSSEIWEDEFGNCFAYETSAEGIIITGFSSLKQSDITIPKEINSAPVTGIGNDAFAYSSIQSVTMPESVLSIGDSAFYSCKSLETVNLPSRMQTIGEDSFGRCVKISQITIPEGITELKSGILSECASLKQVSLPSAMATIGEWALWNCILLEQIVLPDTVTKIENYAFLGCTALKEVRLPKKIASIADGVFEDCASIESIIIPNGVSSIGKSAFSRCVSLTEVTIPSSVTRIADGAFWDCSSLTITCDLGSYAEQYAMQENIQYKLNDEETEAIGD